jgi:hypothetical protein
MASLDWSQCTAVESVPDRRSGAWVFRDTRMPVAALAFRAASKCGGGHNWPVHGREEWPSSWKITAVKS